MLSKCLCLRDRDSGRARVTRFREQITVRAIRVHDVATVRTALGLAHDPHFTGVQTTGFIPLPRGGCIRVTAQRRAGFPPVVGLAVMTPGGQCARPTLLEGEELDGRAAALDALSPRSTTTEAAE